MTKSMNQSRLYSMKNTHQRTLICTIGLPFSGKATWAKAQGLPVIDLEISEKLMKTKSQKNTSALEFTRQMIQSLFLSGNSVVILLAENLTRKEREFWQSKDSFWNTQYREFSITELEAIRLAQTSGASKAVIDQIKTKAKAYEPLSLHST